MAQRTPTFYNHYSAMVPIEASWDVHTLVRFGNFTNVFGSVPEKTGQ